MPTYTYSDGNKDITSDAPLTEDELSQLFDGQKKKEGSLVAESLRTGASSGLGVMAGLAGAANELVSGRPLNMIGGFTRQYEPVKQGAMEMLGSTGVKPKSQSEQILFGGISGISDPTTYMFGPAKYLSKAPSAVKAGYQALQGFAGGAGSEAGGIVGEKVAGEKGRVAGAIIGGTGAGMLAGGTPRIAATATPLAVSKTKSLIAKYKGTEPLEEAEKAAQKHIDNIFVAASTADPNFADTIEQAIIAQQKTGIKMPLSAMLKDNPVLNSYIRHLASKDPEFKKQFYSQFEQAKSSLEEKTEKLFGSAANADDILSRAMAGKADDFAKASKTANRVALKSNADAEKIAAELEQVNPNEFGSRVVDITDAAEKSARSSVAPMYNKAFDIAKTKKLQLTEEAVSDIYQTVVDSKNSDIFATFPSIYNRVKTQFRPKMQEASQLVDAAGKPLTEAKEVFSAASIEDLDSLKREINAQLRGARTDSHIRVLQDLKSKVDSQIKSLDAEFVDAYKNADKAYLMKVGLPFNEETIRSIERTKFNENLVPLLTKNKSTVSQFITATGDNGKKLVEDALVSDFAKFAVKDGVIDGNKAKAWMASKREVFAIVPDIKANIDSLATNSNRLLERARNIAQELDNAAASRILKASGMNTQELIGKMYGSKVYATQFIKQYGNDSDAMKAVRSFLLDDIVKSNQPLDLLNDRTKSGVYDVVFGSAYKDKVKQLAIVSDRLTKDPSAVAINLKDIDSDMLTQMIGMKPERLTSLFFTNPVVSKPVAVMTVINRFFNKKAGEIVERDMKHLLLDKEGSTRILHAMSLGKNGELDMDRINSFAKWAARKGYDFSDMLKQDAIAGAQRSSKGMNKEELDTGEYAQ